MNENETKLREIIVKELLDYDGHVQQFVDNIVDSVKANPLDLLVSLPPIKWQYEDELPEMTDEEFDGAFMFSQVIGGVRMYPYYEINGTKHFARSN